MYVTCTILKECILNRIANKNKAILLFIYELAKIQN